MPDPTRVGDGGIRRRWAARASDVQPRRPQDEGRRQGRARSTCEIGGGEAPDPAERAKRQDAVRRLRALHARAGRRHARSEVRGRPAVSDDARWRQGHRGTDSPEFKAADKACHTCWAAAGGRERRPGRQGGVGAGPSRERRDRGAAGGHRRAPPPARRAGRAVAVVAGSRPSAPPSGCSRPATAAAPPAANDAVPLGTATVQRRDLVDREDVDGTLGFADAAQVAAPAGGHDHAPARRGLRPSGAAGRCCRSTPRRRRWVLYGTRPMYRDLGPGVADGRDVRQLERNLEGAGLRPRDGRRRLDLGDDRRGRRTSRTTATSTRPGRCGAPSSSSATARRASASTPPRSATPRARARR